MIALKLSQPLSKSETAALTSAKESLAKFRACLDAHCKHLSGLHGVRAKLEAKHAKLENAAAGGSSKASIEMIGLRDQRMRLQRTIELAGENAHEHKPFLYEAVNNAQVALAPVIRDLQAQLEDQVESALAPHFAHDANARAICRQTDSLRALGGFFNGTIGQSAEEMHAMGTRFLTVIEALEAGGEIWTYTREPALADDERTDS